MDQLHEKLRTELFGPSIEELDVQVLQPPPPQRLPPAGSATGDMGAAIDVQDSGGSSSGGSS